jgi:hypothetical protein
MEIIMPVNIITQPTAITNTPQSKNFLSPLNFQFQLKRAPHVNFFIQKISIPSIGIPEIDIPTPFVVIPEPGSTLSYGHLDITFKVDEDFANYLEIHDWIRALAFPENFEEYAAIVKNPEYTGDGIRSDISLIVLDNLKNPNFEVIFRRAFPVTLTGIEFDTTMHDVQFLTTTASFRYLLYDIKKIT